MNEGDIVTALGKIRTELATIRVQTVAELGGIKDHLAKLNSQVSTNTKDVRDVQKDIVRLQEAKEWQERLDNMEREDRRRDVEKIWDWIKRNGVQTGTLIGVIIALVELFTRN